MNLISELKRRNVIRMAGLYLVGAWLLTQVSATVLPLFNAPIWMPRGVVIALAVGFIPAMIFAWIFELTPDGLKRDSEIPEAESIAPQTAKRINRLIVAGLLAVITLMAVERFWFVPKEMAVAKESVVTQAASVPINSIAVLPFQNKNSDADTEYLSDGLAESLIYRLAQLPNLKVSPSSSIFRYKGKDIDPVKVGAELGVSAVMTGRLVQRGGDLSISVELLDVRNNKLLWGEQYNRKMSELLATQREIAVEITNKLQLKLTGDEAKGVTKRYTNNNEAYQLYLRGRYHSAKRTKEGMFKSIEYFQQAIKLDPNFALAYAMIADSYNVMPAYPYLSPKEAFQKSQAAAKRALEIDPMLAEAHVAMATSLSLYDWNWVEAEREFQRAIELDPKNSLAHLRFAICFYLPTGRTDEAVNEAELAVELEPLNLVNGANLTWMYGLARRNEDTLAQGKKVYDLEPDFILGRYLYALALNNSGMYKEAIALTEKPLQADPANQLMLQVAGYAYAKMGRKAEANAIIAHFKEIRKTQYVMSFFVATIYVGLGEKEKAFAELETAFQERDWRMSVLMKTEPMLDPLREDPRYKDLLKRMGLPE